MKPIWRGGGQVVDPHARRVLRWRARGQHLPDRPTVVGRLVGEGRRREQVHGVDHQQQPLGELQMQVPGARSGRQVGDRQGVARVADVEDGHTVAEHVTDVGVAVLHHDLDAVTAAALVGVAEQADVVRKVRSAHARLLSPVRRPSSSIHPPGMNRPVAAAPVELGQDRATRGGRRRPAVDRVRGRAASSRYRPTGR